MKKIFSCCAILCFILLLTSTTFANKQETLYIGNLNDANKEVNENIVTFSESEKIDISDSKEILLPKEDLISNIKTEDNLLSNTITEHFADKNFKLKHKEIREAEGIQVNDRAVYIADDGSIAEYDVKTGQLVSFINESVNDAKANRKISEQEALNIAKKYFLTQCDLSEYQLSDISFNECAGYTVRYSKYICGIMTTQIISICISEIGDIQWFVYNPYVFDNVSIDNINESDYTNKLEEAIKSKYANDLIKYDVKNKRLAKDEDNNIVLEFFVSIERNVEGHLYSTGEVFRFAIQQNANY